MCPLQEYLHTIPALLLALTTDRCITRRSFLFGIIRGHRHLQLLDRTVLSDSKIFLQFRHLELQIRPAAEELKNLTIFITEIRINDILETLIGKRTSVSVSQER